MKKKEKTIVTVPTREEIENEILREKYKDKYIYIASVPVRILGGVLTFNIIYDVLPIFASLIDGYTLTMKKKGVVIGAIISYTLWVIYDICVMSISGAITDGIIVLSNLSILIFGYNILKKGENEVINLKRINR